MIPVPQMQTPYVGQDGSLTPQGEVFIRMARAINAMETTVAGLEARIASLEATALDHEARITALEP